MDGIFECLVKCKTPVYAPFVKAFTYAFAVISFFAVVMLHYWIFIVALIGFGCCIYFLLPYLDVEYEYVFVDGSFSIDRILSKSKRKTVCAFEFDRIDAVAPISHPDISRNLNNPGVKVVDYSSKSGDDGVYGMLYSDQNERRLLLIEPNDRMIKALRRFSSRKVTI